MKHPDDPHAPAVLPLVQALYADLETAGVQRLLTPAEEIALSKTITGENPDHPTNPDLADPTILAAVNRLTAHNLRLVIDLASRVSRKSRSLPLEDLISVGWEGCRRAACKYDWRRGYRFSTYATRWILQAIGRANTDLADLIRLPVYQHGVAHAIQVARAQFFTTHERYPSDTEVVLLLRPRFPALNEQKVREVTVNPILRSLDEPVEDEHTGDPIHLGDALVDPSTDGSLHATTLATASYVADLLHDADLSDREDQVIRLRFGFAGPPLSLEAVGKRLGVTRERIRQVEAKALRKLRLAARGAERAA